MANLKRVSSGISANIVKNELWEREGERGRERERVGESGREM